MPRDSIKASLLPEFIRKRIEQACEEALHPKGMSTHDGMARIHVSDVQRLLKIIDVLSDAGNP